MRTAIMFEKPIPCRVPLEHDLVGLPVKWFAAVALAITVPSERTERQGSDFTRLLVASAGGTITWTVAADVQLCYPPDGSFRLALGWAESDAPAGNGRGRVFEVSAY